MRFEKTQIQNQPILLGIKRKQKLTKNWNKIPEVKKKRKQIRFEKTQIQNQVPKTQNMTSHKRRYVIYGDNDPPPTS
jgi:hypothetical protein